MSVSSCIESFTQTTFTFSLSHFSRYTFNSCLSFFVSLFISFALQIATKLLKRETKTLATVESISTEVVKIKSEDRSKQKEVFWGTRRKLWRVDPSQLVKLRLT